VEGLTGRDEDGDANGIGRTEQRVDLWAGYAEAECGGTLPLYARAEKRAWRHLVSACSGVESGRLEMRSRGGMR
jgi:hypothetical protein